ncbi:AraC family transcriptional regulator [Shinella sp. CPCC 100929]|uniref:AraC family transcriptional regulator n=1 Tax=Shinella lacus TaxID=2654216 RepID=A0ABT1REE1_9HYPH|nr:AraC family transcriptional regulator [Shinella lacus]MCQ4633563.1 AraC family transcriptional regulator [Shinella lacus]
MALHAVQIEVACREDGMLRPISQARFLLFSGDGMTPSRARQLYSGEKRHGLSLPRLQATYAWMPPFEGASRTRANRLEVVFSCHDRVALEQSGRTYDVEVAAGGFYVIGEEPTTLLSVPEHSDTLEMYPHTSLLDAVAEEIGRKVPLEPTLGRHKGRQQFAVEPLMLGIAHVLRQACLGQRTLSPIEASGLEHALVRHLLGPGKAPHPKGQLRASVLARVVEKIESDVAQVLTLDDLASEAGLSPFHFARAFRRTTGLAPHRYVLARRMDLAKNRILNTRLPITDIAASIGFENPHHFRRQFRAEFGVLPGDMRGAGSRETTAE